ncbi:MAG: hypothetical protein NVSMB3_07980 [Acidobacteriaceae bacterium]
MQKAMMRAMAAGMVMAGLWAGAVAQEAQPQQTPPVRDPAAVTVGGAQSGAAHSWTTEQLVTSTVHQAWVLSGRNEDQFFDMVKELAAMSAQKRGLTLPETAEAGAKAGAMIKRLARKDPDQLLYAVVDTAVMKTAGKTGKVTGK